MNEPVMRSIRELTSLIGEGDPSHDALLLAAYVAAADVHAHGAAVATAWLLGIGGDVGRPQRFVGTDVWAAGRALREWAGARLRGELTIVACQPITGADCAPAVIVRAESLSTEARGWIAPIHGRELGEWQRAACQWDRLVSAVLQ